MEKDIDFFNSLKNKVPPKSDYGSVVLEIFKNGLITDNEYELLNLMVYEDILTVFDYYNNNIYFSFSDLLKRSKYPINKLKGVLGNLVKKGLVFKSNRIIKDEDNEFSVSSYVYGIYSEEEFVKITD